MTAAELAAKMQRRAAAVERELARELRDLAVDALRASKRHMTQDIYAKPVDRRANGKPKWTRTGALRSAERIELDAGRAQVRLVNDMSYAKPRHEAGKDGRRKTSRPAHWRDEMLAEIGPTIAERARRAVERALRNP